MQYQNAKKSSASSPCTNVPVHCLFCPTGSSGQPATFWKYNFFHHMTVHHLSNEGEEFPPLPFNFLKSVHVSFSEGILLGIAAALMTQCRDDWGLPASDDLKTRYASRPQTWEFMQIKQPGRKRGESEVSKSSHASSGREPTPSKIQRTLV